MLIIYIALLCSHLSCKEKGDNKFEDFFGALKGEINRSDLIIFEEAPVDSASIYFGRFYYEYQEILNEKIISDDEKMDYLVELQKQGFNFPDYLYLVYNFHGWLNGKEYSIKECREIYERVKELQEVYDEKIEAEAQQIVQTNLTSCSVGDTLELIFPGYESTYRARIKEATIRPYPYSLEIFPFEDTIKLKALLQEKRLEGERIIFRLFIIELTENKILLLGDEYSFGDTVDLRFLYILAP